MKFMTDEQKLSYAEAVKKVKEDGSRGMDPVRCGVSSRSVPVRRDTPCDMFQ
jgi:hypothetical protein